MNTNKKDKKEKPLKADQPEKPDSIVIGVGTGTWDRPKGLPDPIEPAPLPRDHKLSIEEVKEYVAYESLGFCIYTLIPANKIEDMELRTKWLMARSIMQEIVEYLYE